MGLVTVEIVLLALASNLRPTSFVAMHALVHGRSPSRLMTTYVIAGLAFTLVVSAVVLGIFRGVQLNAGTSEARGIAELVAGVLTLALGFAVLLERIPLERAVGLAGGGDHATRRRERAV